MAIERFRDVLGILQAMGVDISKPAIQWEKAKKNYPTNGVEYERKYMPNGRRKPMAVRKLEFQGLIKTLCVGTRRRCDILDSQVFAGADMYYEYEDEEDNTVTDRIRFGSNRPCQWTVKIRPRSADTTARLQKSCGFEYTNLPMFLDEMRRKTMRIPGARHMLIGQSGEFWFVQDPDGFMIEIVLYKVGRAEPDATAEPLLLAEIAPWGCPNLDVAIELIDKYESFLGLRRSRITKSNTALFQELHSTV